MREFFALLIAGVCLSSAAAQEVAPKASELSVDSTQDFSATVLPLTELKLTLGVRETSGFAHKPSLNPLSDIDLSLESELGTGFCVDRACRFIATNYHVVAQSRLRKIKGESIIEQYVATGPNDENAIVHQTADSKSMKFSPNRDLALLELRHPLAHHHGIGFDIAELREGQEVYIYAYPREITGPFPRSLRRFHGTCKGQTNSGLLAFEYELSDGRTIRGGASGGIVVDSKSQQIVGILSGAAGGDGRVAVAVPVQSLVEFLTKVQPYLAADIFPHTPKTISPIAGDLYPRFVPAVDGVLERRPEEPLEIRELRQKAQLLSDSMRNFIAIQTFAWGSGDNAPGAMAAYEVRVVDGNQRFREYPDGKEELRDVPFPALNNAFVPGGEWSELPGFVGTNLRLKIQQAPDAAVNEQQIKVFQYQASAEDSLCLWRSFVDYGFLTTHSKTVATPVYGEVWADQNLNILRISEHCEIPEKLKWKDYESIVTYDWLKRNDESPQLVPVTIYTQAEFNNKLYWCRGHFKDYQVFTVRARLVAGQQRE